MSEPEPQSDVADLEARCVALVREIEGLEAECARMEKAVGERDDAAKARRFETWAGGLVGFAVGATMSSVILVGRMR